MTTSPSARPLEIPKPPAVTGFRGGHVASMTSVMFVAGFVVGVGIGSVMSPAYETALYVAAAGFLMAGFFMLAYGQGVVGGLRRSGDVRQADRRSVTATWVLLAFGLGLGTAGLGRRPAPTRAEMGTTTWPNDGRQ
jgi:hypothetical protein